MWGLGVLGLGNALCEASAMVGGTLQDSWARAVATTLRV